LGSQLVRQNQTTHGPSMRLALYPLAVPADGVIADVEARRLADPDGHLGYECLFITTQSTRPAMAFELLPEALCSPGWKAHVVEQVSRAKSDVRDGEAVYFEPYGDNVR
jgi:hypothetical protein